MKMVDEIENPEIVFVSLQVPSIFIRPYHLGISYIQAYLKEKGIDSVQLNSEDMLNMDLYSIANKILEASPNSKIIGFSCNDFNYHLLKMIIKIIKVRKPEEISVIVGGPTATSSDRLIMQDCADIDICVRREGELTVYEIVQFLKGNLDIEKIDGITYRKNKKIVRTPDRIPFGYDKAKDIGLDILPSPYLTGVLENNLGILTSRGCVFRCIYCSPAALWRHRVRFHSIERVISEIKRISQFVTSKGANRHYTIPIWDDNFASNPERAKQICKAVLKERINNLEFACDLRADRTDEELLRLLYAAGFRYINFGLESAVPRVLRTIKKLISTENYPNNENLRSEKNFIKKVKENVNLAKAIGLNPTVSIITGLPGESLGDGIKTINFVKELKINSFFHNRLTIFPGTEVFRNYKRYGLKIISHPRRLPYYVKYAHDVNKIPILKNSFLFTSHYYTISAYFLDIILGSGKSLLNTTYYSHPFVMINNFYEWPNDVLLQLKKVVTIGSPLFLIYQAKVDNQLLLKKNMAILKELTNDFYIVKTDSKQKVFRLFSTNFPTKPYLSLFVFNLVPFSQVYKLTVKTRGKSEKGRIVITLNTKKEVKGFINLIKESEENLDHNLLGKFVELNVSFLDGCRWGKRECPALNFNKLIVENNNCLKSCMHGEIIGKLGDDRIKIIEKLKQAFVAERDKRGCQKCPINDNCSKCLYPFPIGVEEYCRIRKEYPHTGTVIEAMNKLRDFELKKGIGILEKVKLR